VSGVDELLMKIENAHGLLRVRLNAPDLEPASTRRFSTRMLAAALALSAAELLTHFAPDDDEPEAAA